jgi:phosphoribosyl 1,2-cyclic phosphate phosphodiesterase
MKFIITGSGGCVSIPRPLCQCNICTEARQKGIPYARCGCSLYLEDISLLVDTPEDINNALNNMGIKSLDNIIYSHWDPDHTLGMRVIEQIRLEWLDYYENKKPNNPLNVYASNGVMNDVNNIRNPHGSFMDYYEYMGLIKRKIVNNSIQMDKNIKALPAKWWKGPCLNSPDGIGWQS